MNTDIPQHEDGQPPAKKRCRREGAKWTRSGCLTCKRRRKRCDEAKPSCYSCTRLGLTCEGYRSMWAMPLGPAAQVFKQTESPKRRRVSLSQALLTSSAESSAGQTSPSTCISTLSTPWSEHSLVSVSSLLTEQNDLDQPDNCGRDLTSNDQLETTSPSPSRIISHLSNLDTHYLQYHMEQGSKLLANLETDGNPLRSLIIPRALSSPVLLNALCALSAIHFSNYAQYRWSAENEGANYYIVTMRGLRKTLSECHPGSFPDDAILAVALLCKYEITRGSVKQWAVHLDALSSLVTSRGGITQLEQETAEFIRGLLIYANNVAKITSRRQMKAPTPAFDNVTTRKLDIYVGYTEEILKTCSRIADLPHLSAGPLALALEINTIDTLLHTWTATKTTYILPKGMTKATFSRLHMVAESFRDAAYIYLYSTLERMTTAPSTSLLESPSLIPSATEPTSPLHFPQISTSKLTAITNLLQRIKTTPIDINCEFSALTFPLFIAGCETTSQADRDLVLQKLNTLEANFGIGNVKRAKEVLGILWRSKEERVGRKHWVDVLEGLGWDLILA